MTVLNLRGEAVGLGPLRRDLLDLTERWINDPEIVALAVGHAIWPATRERHEARHESGDRERYFMVYELATMRPIGRAGLFDLDLANRTARYMIWIGEPDCRGKGYGTEATRLVLDYAFHVLNLHNVLLSVFGFNEPAQRAYLRAGFRVVGRWRQAQRVGAEAHDIVFMDCLASEFASPVLGARLPWSLQP